jgi:hypothetical protein
VWIAALAALFTWNRIMGPRLSHAPTKTETILQIIASPTKELLDAQSTWSRQELQAMNDRFVAAVKRAIEQERKRAPQQTPSRSDAA